MAYKVHMSLMIVISREDVNFCDRLLYLDLNYTVDLFFMWLLIDMYLSN